jgi:integrase
MKFVQPIRDIEKVEEIKEKLKLKSHRNYLMFLLGINTGLRVSDILQLKIKHIREKEHIVITEIKTGKAKRILITPTLKRELKDYIKNKNDDEYIVKSRQGGNKPISREMAYKILKDIARAVGLEEVGTHTMRKTFGYHFYEKYKNAAMLMDIFNHSAESITLRYIGVNQYMKDKAMRNF